MAESATSEAATAEGTTDSRNGNDTTDAAETAEASKEKNTESKTDSKDTSKDGESETGEPNFAEELKKVKEDAERWKALARKNEERAKANLDKAKSNAEAQRELERIKLENMSEQERIVAQTKQEARSEVIREFGIRLVSSEFRAAAAGRIAPENLEGLLEVLDLSKFLDDDGNVNSDSIANSIAKITPSAASSDSSNSTDETNKSAGLKDKATEAVEQKEKKDLGQGAGRSTDSSTALNGDPLLAALKAKVGII